ncbi:putative membrane protein [Escherichia coli EPEC C342-62]|nr:putative membrane protein [Escherichia coli EPEC C342-62]
MQNNKRVVFMNVSLNIMQQLINTVYTFIIPPLIIINYGSDINGLISSVKQCLVYLALVEAGVGGAAIVALFKPLSEGDRVLQSQIISEAKYFYSKIGVVFIILLLLFSIIYAQIISDQINIILAISLFVIMGLINAVDFLLISKYQVFLTADNKLYVTSATKILTIILDMGCAYILITEGMNIILVQICSVFIYMIRYVIYYFYFLKKYSYISFDLKNKTALLHQKSAVLIHQISGALVFNSPMILITIFLNLKAASIYSIYMLIFMAIKVFYRPLPMVCNPYSAV